MINLVPIVPNAFQYKSFFKIRDDSNENGGDLVAKVLKDHDVSQIFTLIGGHISPILVAAEKLGIRVIDTRHEVTSVFAADAFARISGKIGVAAVTAGPGVTNTITAVKNAQMAETPLLLLGGATASLLKGRGSLQDIDQMNLLKSVCKYSKSVTCVRHLVPVLREAIQVAYSHTPGPVFVELPLDVLYPYKFVKQEMKIKDNPKGFFPRIMNMYLKFYLRYQFASAFAERDTSPLPVYFPVASDSKSLSTCTETEMEFKAHIEKLVGAANWSKWKRQIELLLRHHDVHDVVCGDRECPRLPAEASAEAIAAYDKAQKAFIKDDSLAQLILVGNMDDSNAELTSVCNTAKSVWEKLLSVYEQSSGQRLDRLMEKFFRSEKELEDDIASHIAKLQRNFSELNDELRRVAKTTLPDLLLMSRIMSTIAIRIF
ncbi:2-hydroxyacyl-CoA lyase 2 [Trichonephila clavata]|uniref:2-hydroxyacyl-CoA lyase 2 n=1 Tax=Trichonephila clavata TaxID=2740835 RepID=A0A8X6KFG0_TRICU|nr:2-hydroxyacyl-CoA lyase 2 [Trichonephila clavata]